MTLRDQARNSIGLALGAGAARGWAHIGVIERLVENGIVPAVVAGTSIGALAGGMYAASRLEALKDFALSLTKRRVFSLLDVSWRGSGIFGGEKLAVLLEEQIGGFQFADLRVPFICIATELATGHEVWLRSGMLSSAMRASYALPGIFKPVRIGEHWFIDGGVVNPIPVSACRALGARMVIAVNLSADSASGIVLQNPPDTAAHTPASQYPSLASVLVAAFNITQDRLSRSRLAGDPPDISLSLRTPGLSLFDFAKAEEAIAAGRSAADLAMPEIERMLSRV